MVLSAPLVSPDKVSVPVEFDVKATRSSSIKTVPDEGIDAESARTILVDESVNAPFNVDVIAPETIPPQSPKPQPAADSSTAGPME